MGFERSGFIISADLGQVNDFTAITVIERKVRAPEWSNPSIGNAWQGRGYNVYEEIKECHLRHIERPERGTPYPKIVERLWELYTSPEIDQGLSTVVVDLTGLGRPVWDYMKQKGFDFGSAYGITITGGNTVTKDNYIFHVPKRDLISSLQVAFQNGNFKIAKKIPHADTLIKELINFKVKININGHDSYEAWREGDHDDLVLSAAMGVWLAQRQYIRWTY